MSEKQEWHHSGAACCSPFSTCLLSWCCPCILYGRAHHRVKSNGNMQNYSCTNSACLIYAGMACLGLSWIPAMLERGDLREKYHLKGNGCTDCLCACCCAPCDLTQQDKETEYRESQHLIAQQPVRQAYMQYTQPQ
ncbi:PLAC8-domain-containing protein [Delitschia confertaspora ATCC 74209]|uniref:PLAC8-domain-containing protein n=1 Tax=Delitschia confertaspora ATCC 74209 TaxID=1513339 RepID=A0A9P4JRD2_9PLEO|nr:PLAC8-domain-containing protein [Delitschia confertaspora ATCC 74209]